MARDDILFYIAVIGAPMTLLSCAYQIISYHWPSSVSNLEVASNKKMGLPLALWANLVIALIVCGAVGIDYYDRNSVPPQAIFTNWGVGGVPGSGTPQYTAVLDVSHLQKYAESSKIVIVARNGSWTNVDPLTDTAIEKSVAYSIDGPSLTMSFLGMGKIRYGIGQPNTAVLYAVMLPNSSSPDQITRIADIKTIGGKIVATAGQVVVGAPLAQPLQTAPSTNQLNSK